jgi:hypothetical protein
MASGGTIGGSGVVTTTDATVTSIVQAAIGENSAAALQVKVVARRDSNGNAKAWLLFFSVKRTTGDVTIVASVINTLSSVGDLGAVTWIVSADPNADNVNVTVKGQASATIDWTAAIDGVEILS